MKAIAVIGYHHTGKTTTVVNIVRRLSELGYRVATIKDIHSEKFRADTPGKNSALHIDAGSKQTVARGLYDTSLIFPRTLALSEIVPHLSADFLVIEGMKDAPVPKIVCAKETKDMEGLLDDTTIGISGIIANSGYKNDTLPIYPIPEETNALCEMILARSFELLPAADPDCCSRCGTSCLQMAADILQGKARREDCVLDGSPKITLTADGKEVQIVPFVQDILKDSILAILKNLRDIPDNARIEINILP